MYKALKRKMCRLPHLSTLHIFLWSALYTIFLNVSFEHVLVSSLYTKEGVYRSHEESAKCSVRFVPKKGVYKEVTRKMYEGTTRKCFQDECVQKSQEEDVQGPTRECSQDECVQRSHEEDVRRNHKGMLSGRE